MRPHIVAATVIALVCGALPAVAQHKPGWKRQPTPYRGVFQTDDLKQTAAKQQDAPALPPPAVVCGMRVIPMDPNIDPKMVIPRPPGDTRYTMRVIPPPVCK